MFYEKPEIIKTASRSCGKCAKFVQNFALFCRKGAKSVQKFCAVLRAKHKTLLVLRVFCAISNGSALFCFAQNAQKQRKTAHFAQIRKEMHIPGCDLKTVGEPFYSRKGKEGISLFLDQG